ncbi:rhamnosyltransferase [Candidatus Liberibacter solanacearum]|uniref:rhamnan synthesis F family protein n=1 Tax=Candidatus Liberibacter solanacearum TaxID=556287 RepID=UPI003870F728
MSFLTRQKIFRLKIKSETLEKLIFRLDVENKGRVNTLYIPANISGYYMLCSLSKEQKITSEDVFVEEVTTFKACLFWLRSFLTFSKYSQLSFPSCRIFFYGSRKDKKAFFRLNRFMSNSRMPFDGKKFLYIKELFEGWKNLSSLENKGKITINSKIAIVVHCYYQDTWDEISHLLLRLNFDFDLFITTVKKNKDFEQDVLKNFPSARLYVMENKGRDVLPFLCLLKLGVFDDYDYLCKIHGKKSARRNYHPFEGILWRRWIFFDLLGFSDIATRIINKFEQNPSIGMIGSGRFRRYKKYSFFKKRSKVYKRVVDLARRIDFPVEELDLDFFNGTMFWVRPKCLEPLRNIHLTGEFEEECNLEDGALEHAVERFFPLSVQRAGFSLESVDCVAEYDQLSQ